MKKTLAVVAVLLIGVVGGRLSAQSGAQIGITTAATLAGCQSIAVSTECIYGPVTAPALAVSNGGAFVPVGGTGSVGPAGPQGPAGPTGPQGPAGNSGATWTKATCSTWSGGNSNLSMSGCLPQ